MKKATIENFWKWNTIFCVVTVFMLSTLWHFLYDLIPVDMVGVFAPRNESLAEHVKIVFYPILMWWTITYVIFRKAKGLNVVKWFISAFIATFLSVDLLVAQYCVIFFGFSLGVDNFLVHILIELISFIFAFLIGFHVYKRGKESKIILVTFASIIFIIAVLMGVFAFYPPIVPIFISP